MRFSKISTKYSHNPSHHFIFLPSFGGVGGGLGWHWAFLFFTTLVFSQQEASVWYFGQNAGIKFDALGNVTALTDGQLNTLEGCTSIADSSGNLLFYTDGSIVYNKNHVVMQNGFGLLGSYSTTQSATIVPKPGSTNLYYVFTLDALANINGFRYSVIDMNLDSGNGGVTSNKNVLIYTPTCEKLSIVKHANNTDYWVVTHGWNNNSFHSYRLTSSGLSPTPITSNVGITVSGTPDNTMGYMKIAPNGSKLAVCHTQSICQLLDFDNATGMVSNPLTLYTNNSYGVEFSPNSKVLYLSGIENSSNTNKVFQFDLSVSNITASMLVLYSNTADEIDALQLGTNNKIYMAQLSKTKLGVINNPNVVGFGCNFQVDAVDLLGRYCYAGLPPFITSFFNSAFTTQNLCFGDTTLFSLNTSTPIVSVLWDFGDTTSSTATTPSHTYSNTGTYTVSVTVTTSAGVQPPTTKNITISAVPIIANTVSNQTLCDSETSTYNLSNHTNTVLGSQNNATFGVAYFLNTTDLTNHTNVLPINYSLPLGVTTIYVKVYNLENTSCYAQDSFTITKYLQPIANTLSDYVICENTPYDNIEQFDLSTKNAQLLGTQTASEFAITYYGSQPDADASTNPLPTLYTNTSPSETVYYRIENILHPACYATKALQIKVIHQPNIATVTDFKKCDDATNDGFETFDLSVKTTEVLNGQSSTIFQVNYFPTSADATANTNEITTPITNTTNNQMVYYTITAIGNVGCKAMGDFKLIVNKLPKANTPNAIYSCDDATNDGVESFNLQSNNATILGSQLASDFTINYFFIQADSDANINPLAANYTNTSNPQTIFVRIQNSQNASCFATTFFQIGLYKLPKANKPNDLVTCDDATNNGKESFDLSVQNPKILLLQNPTDYNITYHLSQPDADAGWNAIATNFTNTTNPQTIFVRIENKLKNTCFDTTTFDLIVRDKPNLNMLDIYSICQGKSVTVDAPIGFSSYTWSNGATTHDTTFYVAGDYSILVTKNYGDIICNDTKNIKVYNSNKATITNIEIQDWSDIENSIIVYVTGDGDYQYSLDGYNYQDSAQFLGLPSGNYTVYVKDKKGCGITKEEDIFLLMYPKFFSPNGDGINDLWQIKFSEIEPKMKLTIFDRFGKLITQFEGLDLGWDGKLNGLQLIADDYWFVVTRENGKEYKGHFSLRR
jgi:gliding motility-associated-like protein